MIRGESSDEVGDTGPGAARPCRHGGSGLALRAVCALALALVSSACRGGDVDLGSDVASRSSESAPHDVVHYWAPIHVQDVDATGRHALAGKSDFIAAVDYDGNWDTRDNWDNTGSHALDAVVYHSLVETETHYFIVYAFYHPRDWCDDRIWDWRCGEHENDLEGVLMVVRKSPTEPFGVLEGIVTVFHDELAAYGSDEVTRAEHGGVLRVVTAQEARGHGLKAFPDVTIAGGGGVVYYPSASEAQEPESADDRHVLYELVDIFAPGGLWEHRDDPATFSRWGVFAGDKGGTCGEGRPRCDSYGAHAPWGWAAGASGQMAVDPAPEYGTMFTDQTIAAKDHTYAGIDYVANPYDSR